jgi:hypothetical protein
MPRHPIVLSAIAGSLFLALPAPVAAQDTGEKVNQLIVYGDDPCPQSAGDEITVCARKGESERYRIPEPLRGSTSPQNDAWNNKVLAYETVGATGTMSCSPVGAGGSLGCTQKMIDAAYAEKREGTDVKFGQLIAAERAKRLATIDTEAADTQKRVEELEKQYEDRRRAEEAAASSPAPQSPVGK